MILISGLYTDVPAHDSILRNRITTGTPIWRRTPFPTGTAISTRTLVDASAPSWCIQLVDMLSFLPCMNFLTCMLCMLPTSDSRVAATGGSVFGRESMPACGSVSGREFMSNIRILPSVSSAPDRILNKREFGRNSMHNNREKYPASRIYEESGYYSGDG